jgi:hypothetical protein
MNFRNKAQLDQPSLLFTILIIISLIAYILPWVVNSGTSLTLNAYDLADWTSLTPDAHSSSPILFTSLLLRLPVVCIAFLITMHSATKRWIALLLVICFAIALLPPFEFITRARDDINYRQQFALATVTVVGGWLILGKRLVRFRSQLEVTLLTMGLIGALSGLVRAVNLMQQFELSTQPGAGIVLLTVVFLSLVIIAIKNKVAPDR